MSFRKKNILITGSTKGLGKELVIEFDKLEANLIIIGRSKKLLNQIKKKLKNSKNHLFFNGNIINNKIIKNLILKINKKFNKIDTIIHCLGGSFGINDPFASWKSFETSLKGNLGTAIEINNFFIPKMIKKKQGNIIHVGSVVTHEANASVPYVTSKASISGYVRVMGNYLSKHGVVLSGILPGAFYGDDNAMARFKYYKPKEYNKFINSLPNKKMPLAKDYLETIKLLSSNKSKIFSGSLIYLDQGQSKTIHQIFK